MKIFITSDQHFFHYNIIEYCDRPFQDEYEMNEVMLNNWNETVNQEDVVFHLGDLTAGIKERYDEVSDLVKKLNGKKYLIKGNHDHFSNKWYKNHDFIDVLEYKVINNVFLLHYPIFINNSYLSAKIQKFYSLCENIYYEEECKYLIHGHSHIYHSTLKNTFNVSVDLHDFRPVLVDEIFEFFKENTTQKEKFLLEKRNGKF